VSQSRGRIPAGQHIATKPTLKMKAAGCYHSHPRGDPQTLEPRTPCVLPTDNHQAALRRPGRVSWQGVRAESPHAGWAGSWTSVTMCKALPTRLRHLHPQAINQLRSGDRLARCETDISRNAPCLPPTAQYNSVAYHSARIDECRRVLSTQLHPSSTQRTWKGGERNAARLFGYCSRAGRTAIPYRFP
jgi:hypothetical protein